VTGSALTGAALITAADALARVVAPVELPVGVVTSVLGGPFLLWVLFRSHRTTEKA
jgi:iron complex transport system permease protein